MTYKDKLIDSLTDIINKDPGRPLYNREIKVLEEILEYLKKVSDIEVYEDDLK